jgi:hypothetical protein
LFAGNAFPLLTTHAIPIQIALGFIPSIDIQDLNRQAEEHINFLG